jgi:hypothetical protein
MNCEGFSAVINASGDEPADPWWGNFIPSVSSMLLKIVEFAKSLSTESTASLA